MHNLRRVTALHAKNFRQLKILGIKAVTVNMKQKQPEPFILDLVQWLESFKDLLFRIYRF